MSKKNGKTRTPIKKNAAKERVDHIRELDVLKLRMAIVQRENNKLKRDKLELQRQLNESQLQLAQLRSTALIESLDKSDKTLDDALNRELALLKTAYGIDLTKDKVDITTGEVTWGDNVISIPTQVNSELKADEHEDA